MIPPTGVQSKDMIVNATNRPVRKDMNSHNSNIDSLHVAEDCCKTADLTMDLLPNPLHRKLVAKLLLYQYVGAYNQAIIDSESNVTPFKVERQKEAETFIEEYFK